MEKVVIGEILKPQGIKGEVKAYISIDDGEFLSSLKYLYIQGKDVAVTVENISVREGFAYIFFEGIKDRNDAEYLRGKQLSIERNAIPLKDGEYLESDIIGCRLIGSDGTDYGIIRSIDSYGSAPVYTIADNNGKIMRFPLLKRMKAEICIKDKTMKVDAAVLSEAAVYED